MTGKKLLKYSCPAVALQRHFLAWNSKLEYLCQCNLKEKMRRVAIPIVDNKLSEFFGGCNFYEVFEIDDGQVRKSSVEVPTVDTVDELPKWLEQRGITDVIVYKIKKEIMSLFASRKINLFVGIHQDTPENLITHYLEGNLESDEKIIHEITH